MTMLLVSALALGTVCALAAVALSADDDFDRFVRS
jgi:hypothetical protein